VMLCFSQLVQHDLFAIAANIWNGLPAEPFCREKLQAGVLCYKIYSILCVTDILGSLHYQFFTMLLCCLVDFLCRNLMQYILHHFLTFCDNRSYITPCKHEFCIPSSLFDVTEDCVVKH